MKKISLFIFIVWQLTACCFAQQPVDLKSRNLELSITGGAWLNFPGKPWVGRTDNHETKNTSALVKAMGDYYLNPHFAIGLYTNFCPFYTHKMLSADNKVTMFEYGAAFKPVFYLSDKTAIKIGANVGWRTHKSGYESTNGHGLGVNCSIEIQHIINSGGLLNIEPGFLSQPVGYTGNDTYMYAYPPIFYINIGYSFTSFK